VFIDVFENICRERGVAPTRVLADLGPSRKCRKHATLRAQSSSKVVVKRTFLASSFYTNIGILSRENLNFFSKTFRFSDIKNTPSF